MSKDTQTVIYKWVIGVLLAVIGYYQMKVYDRVDDTHDYVIRHDAEIKSNKEDIVNLIGRFNSYIEKSPQSQLEPRDKNKNL